MTILKRKGVSAPNVESTASKEASREAATEGRGTDLPALASPIGPVWAAEQVTVFKSSTCQCCANWIDHLRRHGFDVRTTNIEAMNSVKARLGVPMDARSCHTAQVGGYVVEGHVPAADIHRLLKKRPKVTGVSAPAMPLGSPGMEGPRKDAYSVITFVRDGGPGTVFANH